MQCDKQKLDIQLRKLATGNGTPDTEFAITKHAHEHDGVKMEAINSCNEAVQRTYTAEQISKILGVSLRKAYDLCETTTDFKVLRLGKRCVRVHKESFDNWLNGQFNTL